MSAEWRALVIDTTTSPRVSDMQTDDMDDWRWWRQVVVRAAGFPAHGVLRLTSERLARQRRPGIRGLASVPRGVL